MNILVVDDSPFARLQMKQLLEEHGHKVVGEAGDASSACAKYLELKPDAMTLDMVMPGGGGIEVLKALNSQKPVPRVVVVTSLNDEAVAPVKDLGVKHVLNKPVEWPKLDQALKELGI
jgi:two-component system, chemotaxis family, protein-glutamate methylesterase/glutaminase